MYVCHYTNAWRVINGSRVTCLLWSKPRAIDMAAGQGCLFYRILPCPLPVQDHRNKPTTIGECRHVPRSGLDPQDPGSFRILDPILFSCGILEILDPVTATLPWDPRDLGSQTDEILPDPGDPGSSLSKLS